MRIAAIIGIGLLAAITAGGCRSRSDLVEAELRTKERMLRESQAELNQARMVNEAFERDFVTRQPGVPLRDNSGILSPKDITLANGTGGVDDDRQPGDEALNVVVVPKDEDGNPVRAVGTLCVTAWEILPGGTKVPLSSWDVSAVDLRKTWRSGLLGSGYHVRLAWKKLPTQNRLRIAAQLVLSDGRVYEADKDVSIRPMGGVGAIEEKPMMMPSIGPPIKQVEP